MIGTRLGQYRIDALLGQGGMGAVYLATDEMLGRQVAVKVLRDSGDTRAPPPNVSAAKRRSCRASMTRTSSDCTGSPQDQGVLYMVTEFVKGEALQRRLERGGAVDPRDKCSSGPAQVLDALRLRPPPGVRHRDIKPANILIDEREPRPPARLRHRPHRRHRGPDADRACRRHADLHGARAGARRPNRRPRGPLRVRRRPVPDVRRTPAVSGHDHRRPDPRDRRWPGADVATLLPPQAAAFAPVLMHALARQPADRTPTAGQMRAGVAGGRRPPAATGPPAGRAAGSGGRAASDAAAPPRRDRVSGAGHPGPRRRGPRLVPVRTESARHAQSRDGATSDRTRGGAACRSGKRRPVQPSPPSRLPGRR